MDELAVPCAVDSKAFRLAKQELEALEQRIEQLQPTDDPEPIWSALNELLMRECFALSGVVNGYANDAAPSSGIALRTWWKDGGDDWVEQFLYAEMTFERPSVRVAFAPELTPGHPLVDLFCPLAEPDCDVQTRGWKLRANQAFEDHAERRWTRFNDDDDELPAVRDEDRCEALAVSKPSHLRYETWIRCIDHVTLRGSVLPIGGLRVPRAGWFVVRGRRGHYQFCDELRAFDLATGSVHAVASCSGLALRNDGSVDGAQTNAGRVLEEKSGRVPVDALREAVWMALWSSEMSQHNQLLGGNGYWLPEAIEPMGRGGVAFGLMGLAMSTGQTTLDWTYVRDGHPSVSGKLSWPEDYNDGARNHTARLLQIAESAMVVGCAPAAVPKISFAGGGTSVSPRDADRRTLSETQLELERVLARMKAPKCEGS
jgi:hypothetical protein